jgi:NADPH:quinone reductase-like Zn-dependent oxidoreductase
MDRKTARSNGTLPSAMKAWQYTNARGCLEKNLHLTSAATLPRPPVPGSDDVMIEVISMALNPADYELTELPLVTRLLVRKPASPGLDFCGRVVSCTDGSSGSSRFHALTPGELVFGRLDFPYQHGTLGQFIKAPRSGVVSLPAGVHVDQAAGISTAALTAYQSLVPYVKNGDRVFINGGSGGVGIFAIQIAKILGCHVVVSCSGANAQLCKDLGADEVIDYTISDISQTLKSRGQVFDLLVDNVSRPYDLYKASDHFLQGKTPFIQVAAADDSLRAVWSMVPRWLLPRILGGGKHPWRLLMVQNSVEELARIGEWVREGKMKVILDSVFDFKDAPKAFERLRTHRARGKVVVNVTERPSGGALS